jgi:hypothetical protein
MTWPGWLALGVSQLVAIWVVLFLLFRDLPRSLFLFEKLVCLVLGVGLLGVDAAVLFGYVGPGWPVSARYSLAVLAVAVAAWLLNDVVYLAVKGPDSSHLPAYPGYDVRARHRRLITLRLVGLVGAAITAYWVLPPGF